MSILKCPSLSLFLWWKHLKLYLVILKCVMQCYLPCLGYFSCCSDEIPDKHLKGGRVFIGSRWDTVPRGREILVAGAWGGGRSHQTDTSNPSHQTDTNRSHQTDNTYGAGRSECFLSASFLLRPGTVLAAFRMGLLSLQLTESRYSHSGMARGQPS